MCHQNKMKMATAGVGDIIPLLKHDYIANGIMHIQITNFDDIHDDNEIFIFILKYKIHSHQHTITKDSLFYIENIDNNNRFYVKLPMFLSPYKFEYSLEINIESTTYEFFDHFTSSWYIAMIQSNLKLMDITKMV